ncbi:MAG: ABC transporter substrate-binding protein [Thermomicrobiales bacterium]
MNEHLSRRRVVASGFAIGAGVALSQAIGRGAGAQTPVASPAASPADGAWSFTDDRGITVTLPERPTSVIAQTSSAASLWDFGFEVIGFFGPNDPDNTAGFPQVGDMDVTRLPNVGDYGALDLEKVVALRPELYVDLDRGGDTLWYLDADSQAAIEQICPTIGINADGVSVIDIVKRYDDLAVALGVDPASETIATAKATFAASETAFTETVAAHGGLKVLTVSSGADGTVYIWNPNWLPDLIYFTSLGFTGVEAGVDDNTPNAQVSMETLGDYPADVILVDVREDMSAFEGNAIWESLPAVQAGQVGRWYAAFPYSYQKLARVLDLTGETLAAAKPVV